MTYVETAYCDTACTFQRAKGACTLDQNEVCVFVLLGTCLSIAFHWHAHEACANKYRVPQVTGNRPTATHRLATDLFPGASLAAAAAYCLRGFRVGWDTLCYTCSESVSVTVGIFTYAPS
jgi:hypothetical protein